MVLASPDLLTGRLSEQLSMGRSQIVREGNFDTITTTLELISVHLHTCCNLVLCSRIRQCLVTKQIYLACDFKGVRTRCMKVCILGLDLVWLQFTL